MSTTVPVDAAVRDATRATYAAFIGTGFAFASWASRIPQVKAHLALSPADLGLVLLAIAAGAVVALPISGVIVGRLGTRGTVTVMATVLAVAFTVMAVGYVVGVPLLIVGLFLFGFSNGAWDVAMNVQGAAVERRLGHSILSRFHAGYSLGTVLGALLGAVVIALHVPVSAHLIAVAAVVAVTVPYAVRSFLPDTVATEDVPAQAPVAASRSAFARWREPRTLLIGVFVLAFAFSEGTGNDWTSVAVVDGLHQPAAVGSLAFAAFLAAMTLGRWLGPAVLDRYGRVAVLRTLTVVAFAGVMIFVFGHALVVVFVGALLWGVGSSLGFPVGMSAAADEPAAAAARVSVVASIGYGAFLGGPPLVGFLGSHTGVLHALTAVAVALVAAAVLSPALRPPSSPSVDS